MTGVISPLAFGLGGYEFVLLCICHIPLPLHPIHVTLQNAILKHLWQKHQSHSTTLRTPQMSISIEICWFLNVVEWDW